MPVNAPPGLPIRWYSHQNTSEKTYGVLKAKLTGIKSQFGHYYSEVKLSEEDADKLIENIKKGTEGFPDLTDKTGIFNEEYQKWLVKTYLPSAKASENQTPSIEDSEEDSEKDKNISKKTPTATFDDDDDDDFEPLGLEEFLENIQNEAKREKSLALYEGTREDDLVSEEVDERLLRLLGLDDVFDIDYSTYMTLLREKLMEARMVDKKISTEESMILTEEYKRIKGKVGRFKLKKKKITADNLGVSGPVRVNKEKYYLTEKAITPEFADKNEEGGDRLLKNVITINETLGRILESLTNQNQAIKKTEEDERKRQERLRRQGREEDLEKGVSKVTAFASKVLAPVRGILDRILNFILYTLLGRAFVKFIDWFNDPKNKEKVEVLKRFLKDWWPALLGALVLFTTPFGGFVRAFIGTVSKLTFRLAKFAIPKLAKFAMKNPITAGLVAGGTLAAGGAYLATQQNTQRREEFKKTDPNIVTPKESKETGKTPGGSQLMQESILQRGIGGFKGGGMIPFIPQVPVESIAYEEGGYIDGEAGVDITGAGPDTQLIAAQPGEIVMSKKAVDKYGAGFLLNLNKSAGGTNIPRMTNNIQFAAGGGFIGKAAHHLQKDEALSSLTKGVNDYIKPGGSSIVSGMNWNSIKPDTPIHAYKDSVGKSTIGWGSTFYDSILSGKKPVKMGDTITKRKADSILKTNIGNLSKKYKEEIPYWNKMSDDQKAGVLVVGYNAPYGPIGTYKKLTKSLQTGDMVTAAKEVQRGGPSQFRLNLERQLLLSGPKDLTKVEPPKAKVVKPAGPKGISEPPKAKVVKPAGPKGIRESLTDEEGLSGLYMKPIRNLFAPKAKPSVPGPPVSRSNQSSIIPLPDIIQQAGGQQVASAGSQVPQIMDQMTSTQRANASIYGIG